MAPYRTVLPAIACAGGVGGEIGLRHDRDRAARQALADVVVGLADEPQLDARARERPERLAGRAPELEMDRAAQVAALEGAGERRPERAIRRGEAQTRGGHGALAAERGGDAGLQRGRRGVAHVAAGARGVGAASRRRRPTDAAPMTGASSARAAGIGVSSRRLSPTTSPTDPGADGRQLAAQVLGDRGEVAHDVVGRAGELGPQVLALGRDAGRAGVEMALARHVAADGDERRRPERELLGAEERGDEQVAAGLEPAVRAERDAVAQVVAEQDLVDLGEPELPRRADVLDRRQRRGARPAGVPGQVDVRGARPWRRPRRSSRPRGSATSFTPIRAPGLIARRSAMSWARSSIE